MGGNDFTGHGWPPGGAVLRLARRRRGEGIEEAVVAGQLAARKASGWPKRCRLAHAFLWEYSYKRLQLAQLLGQLGDFLTCWMRGQSLGMPFPASDRAEAQAAGSWRPSGGTVAR